MIVEILTTGTELLLGQIVNTNSQYLSQKMNELGFDVLYHSTVGDNRERMTSVLSTALSRADIIITSGGLGPTQGDITKEVTANLLNRPMKLHQESLEHIRRIFLNRGMNMPDNNIRQAMIPEGAVVLVNSCGTAPGIIIEEAGKVIIHLPGPPQELKGMFEDGVLGFLQQRFGSQGVIISKELHTFGISESLLEETIKEYIIGQSNPTIALLARKGEILVRLTAKADTKESARFLVTSLETKIRQCIGEYIWGTDEETLESVVGRLLTNNNLTLALAESCTGGLVSSRITDIPGSSAYLMGALVCYSNDVKHKYLYIPMHILDTHGAVSAETASLMASNIRAKFNTSIGIGITGIAGPGGATPNKPVGTVYIAIDGPVGVQCQHFCFTGKRSDIKYKTSQTTLDILRKYIVERV